MNKLAIEIPLGDPLKGFGILGLEQGDAQGAPGVFNAFMSTIIGLLTIIASIWFIFLFITGAIGYMTAGGDKGKIESSSKKMVNGIIGLFIVIAAIFIINLVGYIFGLQFILDPGAFIEALP
jgi:uncharacterized membrane protein